MQNKIHILLIEEADRTTDTSLRICLRKVKLLLSEWAPFSFRSAPGIESGLQALEEGYPADLILMDLEREEGELAVMLERVRQRSPFLPLVLVVPAQGNPEMALRTMQAGVQDVLSRDQLNPPLLMRALLYALERARSERSLRASEERYRRLAEHVTDVIWVLDLDLRVTDASASVERLIGLRREQVLGRPWSDFLTPASYERVQTTLSAEILRVHHGPTVQFEPLTLDLEHPQASGGRVWAESKISLIGCLDQKECHILAVTRDITERREAEEHLTRRAAEMAALYETSLEINAQRDLPTLLQSIIERATRLVQSPHGALYLTVPEGGAVQLAVSHNLPEHYLGVRLNHGEGLAGRAAQKGQLMISQDYSQWEERSNFFEDQQFGRMMAVPLKVGEDVIGVIVVSDTNKGDYSPDEVRLVSLFADQAAIALENKRLYFRIEQLAIRDELTKLYNRRGFFTLAEQQLRVAYRNQKPALLVFVDIDQLKEINDTLGHHEGDRALEAAAAVLVATFRRSDILARIGGDEFAVLALDTQEADFGVLWARLEEGVAHFNQQPGQPFQLSMSVGRMEWRPGQVMTIDDLLAQADANMYVQKRAKRRSG